MWPWIAAGAAGIAAFLFVRKGSAATPASATVTSGAVANNTGIAIKKNLIDTGIDHFANAVTVIDDKGIAWIVAPDYIGPVGIGEAADIAKSAGGELPSPGLVDAIWRQADLKILPPIRSQNIVSAAVFADQQNRIQELIANRPFKLLGGTYKDIVQLGGHPQLYGWHVSDDQAADFTRKTGVPLHKPFSAGPGQIIQGPSGSVHSLQFKDYSQGLRLVKKA